MPTKQSLSGAGDALNEALRTIFSALLRKQYQEQFNQSVNASMTSERVPTGPPEYTTTGYGEFLKKQQSGFADNPVTPTREVTGLDYQKLLQLAGNNPLLQPYLQQQSLVQKLQDPGGLKDFTAKEDIRTRFNVQEAQERANIPDPRFELWKKNLESQIRARETEKPDKEENLRFSEYDDPDTGERVRISYDPKTNKEVSRERVGKSSLTSDIRNRKAALERVNLILDGISELSEKINTGQGILAKLSGGIERVKASANLNDDIAEYQALISGFTPMVARALGHTGVLTEQDVQSVKEMFPKAGDSKTLRDRKINRIKKLLGAMSGQTITEPIGEETKVINGKTYVKKNGQWYESK